MERVGRDWLATDFLVQDVKKWITGSLKASQLSLIQVLKLRDWDGLLSIRSRQIGWLTIQPFIHQMRRPLMTHCQGSVCMCASWYEMKNRWRWRYISDDLCLFLASMWHETKRWIYLRVHLAQSISAWAAFSRIHSNLIRIVQMRGAGLLRKNLSQLLRVHCVPAPANHLRPFSHERTLWTN